MNEPKSNLARRARQPGIRQDQILDAAARLFAGQGFHRTTTREIAEAADVAEGTLYNYFASKDELLMGIMGRLIETLSAQGEAIEALPVEARQHFYGWLDLRKNLEADNTTMMQAVLSEMLANPGLRRRFYDELLKPAILSFEDTLHRHITKGEIRSVEVPETARIFVGLVMGLFLLEVLGDPLTKEQTRTIDQAAISVLFDGLGLKKQPDRDGSG